MNEQFCRNHPLERATFFCQTDLSFLCADCLIPDHKEHDFNSTRNFRTQAELKKGQFEQIQQEIHTTTRFLEDNRTTLTTFVENEIAEIFRLLNQIKDSQLRDINLSIDIKNSTLEDPFEGHDKPMEQIANEQREILAQQRFDQTFCESLNFPRNEIDAFLDTIQRSKEIAELQARRDHFATTCQQIKQDARNFLAREEVILEELERHAPRPKRVNTGQEQAANANNNAEGQGGEEAANQNPREETAFEKKAIRKNLLDLSGEIKFETIVKLYKLHNTNNIYLITTMRRKGYREEDINRVKEFLHKNLDKLSYYTW